MTASEFRSKWFSVGGGSAFGGGAALVPGLVEDTPASQGVQGPTNLRFFTLNTYHLRLTASKVLSTKELLKVKGAGCWKRLWKKTKKFFQAVFRAVAQVLKKVAQAVSKALSTVLGKTIGGGLASILTSPLNIIANSAYMIGQGDFKGLMKYWGVLLIQAAIQAALFFLPGVGQVIGGFMQAAGSFLQAAGSFAIKFGAQAFGPGIIGSLIRSAGSSLIHLGANLVGQGMAITKGANQFWNNLFTNPFKTVQDSLSKGVSSFLSKLNPLTEYKQIWKSFTQGAAKTLSGAARFLTNVLDQVGTQIAAIKIDQSLEKTKMNSFLQSILSTVSNASLQAIGSAFTERGAYSGERTGETNGTRAPPTGAPAKTEKQGQTPIN